jgi:nitronate monooxygenase
MIPKLRIGDLVSEKPIIQGGMGVGISWSRLASAVAKEGGIGVISSVLIGMNEPDINSDFDKATERALRREINKARPHGIVGVNIMVALSNFKENVEVCIDEDVDLIISGAGLPLTLPSFLNKNSKTKLIPIVSSARAASIIMRSWLKRYNYKPDAFVVEGSLAGGHLGFKFNEINKKSLKEITLEVMSVVGDIPVIPAGGIYTGYDIYEYIKLGCSGVQMGTRFVATNECDAHYNFKKAYVDSKEEDIVIIESPVGMPGRALNNFFVQKMNQGKKKPVSCPYNCVKTCTYQESKYCIILALISAQRGILGDKGLVFVGQNAYKVDKIISVKDLINSLTEEYLKAEELDNEKLCS